MSFWHDRSSEERNLLNPSFCSMLLWTSANAYVTKRSVSMPFALSFVVLPFVLHSETRESLPLRSTTSLATWLTEQPLIRSSVAQRAVALRPFTKEALLFGGAHGALLLDHEGIRANGSTKSAVAATLQSTSEEVRYCAKRADFLGRWFEKAGKPETVLALLGVKP